MTVPAPTGPTLPRSATLTATLLQPASTVVSAAERDELRDRLQRELGRIAAGRTDVRIRVDPYLVRSLRRGPGPEPSPPFGWSARGARRTLGLAALRTCLAGPGWTPASAVDEAMRSAASSGGTSDAATRSLGRWLSVLPSGALAAVAAAAVSWATAVYTALDWAALDTGAGTVAEIGGPDRWWDCPTARAVGFRARAEVRVPLPGVADCAEPGHAVGTGGRALALFVVMPAWPGPTARAELGVTALAHVLAAPVPGSAPARVVGWWPQSGRSLTLDVDSRLLSHAAGDATRTVASALARPTRSVAA